MSGSRRQPSSSADECGVETATCRAQALVAVLVALLGGLACGDSVPREYEGLHRRNAQAVTDEHEHADDEHGHDDEHAHDDEHGEHDGHGAHAEHAHGPDDDVIVLDRGAQRRLGVEVARPVRGSLAPTRSVLASVEAPPDQLSIVTAPVDGRLLAAASGLARPGTRVRRGELLATLVPTPSSPELTTRVAADLSRAQADVDAARRQLDRTRALLSEGAIAERRVVDAERELQVAEVALEAARRGSALAGSARGGRGGSGWRLLAPIDGAIDAVFVTDGVSVAAHAPLVRIVGERERWVAAEVPEAFVGLLPPRPSGVLRVVGAPTPITLEADALLHVGRVIDPHRRTVTVRWALDATDSLRVGASGQVELAAGAPAEGLIVPRAALLELDGRTIVVVQVADDEFLDRDVRVGARSGDRLLVTEGLSVDDRVVVEGAALVHLAGGGGGEVHDAHVH